MKDSSFVGSISSAALGIALAGLASGCASGVEPLSAIGPAFGPPQLSLPMADNSYSSLLIPFSQSGLGVASDGFDIQMFATNLSVVAPAGGIVHYVDPTANAAVVYILHSPHLMTRVSKLGSASIPIGTTVSQGQVVGQAQALLPTIHFTVFFDNNVVCPMGFLTTNAQKQLKNVPGIDPCI